MVTSHAASVPVTSVSAPTIAASNTVLAATPGNMVRNKCGNALLLDANAMTATLTTGAKTMSTTSATAADHTGDDFRRPRQRERFARADVIGFHARSTGEGTGWPLVKPVISDLPQAEVANA